MCEIKPKDFLNKLLDLTIENQQTQVGFMMEIVQVFKEHRINNLLNQMNKRKGVPHT